MRFVRLLLFLPAVRSLLGLWRGVRHFLFFIHKMYISIIRTRARAISMPTTLLYNYMRVRDSSCPNRLSRATQCSRSRDCFHRISYCSSNFITIFLMSASQEVRAKEGVDPDCLDEPQEVKDRFMCAICSCIVCELVEPNPLRDSAPCAGHFFCRTCLEKSIQSGLLACPICREPLNSEQPTIASRSLRQQVNSLKCRCSNFDCQWRGQLKSLMDHRVACPKRPTLCQSCSQLGRNFFRLVFVVWPSLVFCFGFHSGIG